MRARLDSIDRTTLVDKARSLLQRFEKTPSVVYENKMRFDPAIGMSCGDLEACTRQVVENALAPRGRLVGRFLDRGQGFATSTEALALHLRRVHAYFRGSLALGMPVLFSLRSFAPNRDPKSGEWTWRGLFGHFVTIVEVQRTLARSDKGFRFVYLDPETGTRESGYISYDEARNFTAAKGNSQRWKWLTNRPFLTVTAPSLRLGTQRAPWFVRTLILANYAIYAERVMEL